MHGCDMPCYSLVTNALYLFCLHSPLSPSRACLLITYTNSKFNSPRIHCSVKYIHLYHSSSISDIEFHCWIYLQWDWTNIRSISNTSIGHFNNILKKMQCAMFSIVCICISSILLEIISFQLAIFQSPFYYLFSHLYHLKSIGNNNAH